MEMEIFPGATLEKTNAPFSLETAFSVSTLPG